MGRFKRARVSFWCLLLSGEESISPVGYTERGRPESQNCPPNVPQRNANQAMHARYAAHARTFFLSDFVSVENKERLI